MHHAAKSLEHGFKTERSVENREDTLPEGVIEAASTLAAAGLGRTNEHHGGGGIDPPEKLEDSMTGRSVVPRSLHGHFQVDQSDVNLLPGDQIGRFPATASLQAPDAHRIEKPRQLGRGYTLSPAAREEQIQAGTFRVGSGLNVGLGWRESHGSARSGTTPVPNLTALGTRGQGRTHHTRFGL